MGETRFDPSGVEVRWRTSGTEGLPPVPQAVVRSLTRAAIFLVVTVNPGMPVAARSDRSAAICRRCCAPSAFAISRATCPASWASARTRGTGSSAQPRPAELHPFREIRAGSRHAVATPGDLLFHIRAKRMDLCFELATQIMARLGGAVSPVDEVHGFRYFDDRDLMGFVDGTENPTAQAAIDAAYIGAEDAAFAGGSYVIVQKYLHDWPAGTRCPPRRRNASSAAPNSPTSSSTTRSSRPRRTTR